MDKYRLFIGSSSEHVKYAEAVQLNLVKNKNLFPVCWHQGVFKLSNYPMEDLINELGKAYFGVFILAPDDFSVIRGKKYHSVRDNVLFEMGLFIGALGKNRTFFMVPSESEIPFRRPSDLEGLNYARYSISHLEEDGNNIEAVVGPACTEIKNRINEQINRAIPRDIIEKYGYFPEFDIFYPELFKNAKQVTTFFIHSRRWRENNLLLIDDFLGKNVKWNVILPNLRNSSLIEHMKLHFDDGDTMEAKILDAYIFFLNYLQKYSKKIQVFLYEIYPTYSFYKFDDKIIISLYPTTKLRKPTPTFKIDMQMKYSDFFKDDIDIILSTIKPITLKQFEEIVEDFKAKFSTNGKDE